MSADHNAPNHSRRTVLRSAAWATPVIAVAAATPAAAASEAPNDDANFHWTGGSSASFGDLTFQLSGERGRFEINTSFRAGNGVDNPPAGSQMSLTVTFSHPITIESVTGDWSITPSSGEHTTFTFVMDARWSQNLNLRFDIDKVTDPSMVSATTSMQILSGGSATWTSTTDTATGRFQ